MIMAHLLVCVVKPVDLVSLNNRERPESWSARHGLLHAADS